MLCGLAVPVRPDLAVPAAIVALPVACSTNRRAARLVAVVALAGAVALPWHLFSWWRPGGFVPDTFALKTASASMYMASAPVGFYGTIYPVATSLTALPVLLAIGAFPQAW